MVQRYFGDLQQMCTNMEVRTHGNVDEKYLSGRGERGGQLKNQQEIRSQIQSGEEPSVWSCSTRDRVRHFRRHRMNVEELLENEKIPRKSRVDKKEYVVYVRGFLDSRTKLQKSYVVPQDVISAELQQKRFTRLPSTTTTISTTWNGPVTTTSV